MLENIRLDRIVFLDIETVSNYKTYQKLPKKWKKLWDKKASFLINNDESPEDIYTKAAIYAEFGKVICISVGLYREINGKRQFRVKSFYGDNEKELLSQFGEMLTKYFESPNYLLCAHNGKEFDFPYLARRILVNQLPLPYLLDIAGRKPWEVQHLDTLQLWKFGDYKHYTSLDLLTALFGIESPKTDMDGSDVGRVYWEEGNLEKIVQYCEDDVIAIAQLLLAYKGVEGIKKSEIYRSKD
ncbi:MAG: 3'-5' exonuclease [Bacteroidetes bacterium]|nr:MAG: 3'-5' exonuclease [Bacteroidota bacterium]MBL1144859.1 3'-5' exonuclease [Bacteroidota bacterium]MCB0803893.1 3'-5' exonuclease [Flavobacteriales bacterium]NOG57653.1 3'-5' exonuclease [Bacteroidota bacterium]